MSIYRETIRVDTAHPFEIFFQTGEGKLELYCASGQKAGEDAVAQIQEQSIDRFFIKKSDRYHYHVHVENNLDSILAAPDLVAPRKAAIVFQTIVFVADHLFKSPRAELVKRYKAIISQTVDLVLEDPEVLRNLIRLTTADFSILNHSVNVGIFSMGLMREFMGDIRGEEMKEAVAGFFLHDIGRCHVPADILLKKGPLTPLEWKAIRTHSDEGCRILLDQNMLTNEAQVIISQHHERYNGSGYPRSLKGDKIHPHARICSLADTFEGLTSFRPFRKEHSSFEAMKIMKRELFKDFDPLLFQKFVRLFGSH